MDDKTLAKSMRGHVAVIHPGDDPTRGAGLVPVYAIRYSGRARVQGAAVTVAELIEKLQALHGDNELRLVVLDVEAHRPYAKPQTFEATPQTVSLDAAVCRIKAWGWLE